MKTEHQSFAAARNASPNEELVLRNQQRTQRVDLRLLRRVALGFLKEVLPIQRFELGIHLVGTAEITRLNEHFLGHTGSTDVITFNYVTQPDSQRLHGEIFICLDEAVAQARRFRTSWQSELVRYLIHGVLHLRGHDDFRPAARRKMKREEDLLVRQIARLFPIRKLKKS